MVLPLVSPDLTIHAILGGLAGGLLILLWWLFLSRAPWLERFGVVGLAVAAVFATSFLVHESIATGAMELESGDRAWKGGRYGYGQLLLLPDQDLLPILTEKGELALVSATPDGFRELARHPALDGKTWNHPVLVEDLLLVRNGREMAAFRLPPTG